MRIVAGAWRGRQLLAPPGSTTRPTADRVRQTLFDVLLHAPWGGRGLIEDAIVLDVFAGTGAFGLEALSRGARSATFFERDEAALRALRGNIAACKVGAVTRVIPGDVLRVGRGTPGSLVLLDPPYGEGLVPLAVQALTQTGWIMPGAVVAAELGRDEQWVPETPLLDERALGAARLVVFRAGG